MEEFNVLSCFDGMSCGQIALNRIGRKPTKYYASEVDKYAIKVTQKNWPDTIQLGDVRNVNPDELPFMHLLLGGSPCQSFSFAGKRNGMSTKCEIEILSLEQYLELKEQKFEFEGESYLFWEYIRILDGLRKKNPDIKFLLENVMMGSRWQKVLTRAIGVNPICINSALVSAQNRERLYWTNIKMEPEGLFGDMFCKIPQPADKRLVLKDILEPNVDDRFYLSDKMLLRVKPCNIVEAEDKSGCFTAGGNSGGLHSDMTAVVVHNTLPRTSTSGKGVTGPLSRKDGKTYCLGTLANTNAIEIRKPIQLNPSKEAGGQPSVQNMIYDVAGTSPALMAQMSSKTYAIQDLNERQRQNHKQNDEKANTFLSTSWKGAQANGMTLVGDRAIRRLTPIECERLQTVPDQYTEGVSSTQRYKMLGNGWTVDVVAHILSYMEL